MVVKMKSPVKRRVFIFALCALIFTLAIMIFVHTSIHWYNINEWPDITSSEGNHFSVVWKGFQPDYSNETPDYYICINNLKDEVLNMHIAMKIENFEDSGYWFMVGPYEPPPQGWNIEDCKIGFIRVDEIKEFVYENISKVRPDSIPQGIFTESIHLVVKAFRDPDYSDLYSQDDFFVNFHFIDLTSTAVHIIDQDNFDSETDEGWKYGYVVLYRVYRSWPASYSFYHYIEKTFDTYGYDNAYMIFSLYFPAPSDLTIYINGVARFKTDIPIPKQGWFQFAIPLDTSTSSRVRIALSESSVPYYLDDVYVVLVYD